MKQVVKVSTVMIKGKPVYQIERVKCVRGNRALALNSRRPALSPAKRVKAAFDALRKAVTR